MVTEAVEWAYRLSGKFCPMCGGPLLDGAAFCTACGVSLASVAAGTPALATGRSSPFALADSRHTQLDAVQRSRSPPRLEPSALPTLSAIVRGDRASPPPGHHFSPRLDPAALKWADDPTVPVTLALRGPIGRLTPTARELPVLSGPSPTRGDAAAATTPTLRPTSALGGSRSPRMSPRASTADGPPHPPLVRRPSRIDPLPAPPSPPEQPPSPRWDPSHPYPNPCKASPGAPEFGATAATGVVDPRNVQRFTSSSRRRLTGTLQAAEAYESRNPAIMAQRAKYLHKRVDD